MSTPRRGSLRGALYSDESNGQNPGAIGHYDVLALAHDRESCLFECPDGPNVIYTGNLSHNGKELDGDFKFSHIAVPE